MSSSKQPESNRPSLWKSMMDSLLGGAAPEAIKPVDDPLDLEGLDLDLLQEIEKKAAPSRPAEVAPRAAIREKAAREEETEQPAPERSKPKVDDDYWNALEGLSWDEEDDSKSKSKIPAAAGRSRPASSEKRSGSSEKRSGEKRSAEKRTEKRSVETPPASQSRSDEFLDDDDFGAGLSDPRPTPAAAPSEDAAEEERRGSRRRRGGRGRRGRGERPASEATPVEDVIDFEEPEEFAPEISSESADDSDDFGAGLEVTPRRPAARPERRPERGNRESSARGGRRERTEESRSAEKPEETQEAPRGRSRREESPREERSGDEGERRPSRRPRRRPETTRPVDEVELDDEEVPVEAEADDDEETAAEREERYRNVPSWEEAISYLIQPKRRSGGSGPRSSDRSRQSRGSNGGNGGGRSSGGRGRSSESR